MSIPYLIYGIKTYESPYPDDIQKWEMEKQLLLEGIEYHYRFGSTGNGGFPSKVTTLQGILDRLPDVLQKEWNTHVSRNSRLDVFKIATTDETLEQDKADAESLLGEKFVRWYIPAEDTCQNAP